jgi:proteasome accessory factor A
VPVRMLLGVETEYAVTGIDREGRPVNRPLLVQKMLEVARRSYPHLLDGSGGGLFLANGARLYVDRGSHPEFATPECDDPRDVVRYIRAGEAMLLDLAKQAGDESGGMDVQVFRSNVDYGRSGSTWGCHESYLYRSNPAALAMQLIPHLVSRLIYAGPGGFNPLSPGLEFTLSPRAWLLSSTTSTDSTSDRGIYHLKDESLSGPGWHRLHVICGESLCSDTAALLKVGTTALVLATIEACHRPGDAVRLAEPVAALRTVAAGLDRKKGLELLEGGRLSAADIQRHYLAEVETCRQQGLLPPWADAICGLWRRQLDALESDSPSLVQTLDWAIKRAVYRRWTGGRMSWDQLLRCGEVLRRLERTAARMLGRDAPPTLDGMLSPHSPFRREVHRLTPLLAAEGMEWNDLREFSRLRHQLFETDLRFGQLGERGVFSQLDRQGVLSHRTGAPGEALPAPAEPPARGRARVRGDWIRRLAARPDGQRYRADWSMIWDKLTIRRLDLSDPFVAAKEWI